MIVSPKYCFIPKATLSLSASTERLYLEPSTVSTCITATTHTPIFPTQKTSTEKFSLSKDNVDKCQQRGPPHDLSWAPTHPLSFLT